MNLKECPKCKRPTSISEFELLGVCYSDGPDHLITYDLNSELFVCYSSHGLKMKNNELKVCFSDGQKSNGEDHLSTDHLNSKLLVRYSRHGLNN